MDTEAIAIAAVILILLVELGWCVSIIIEQRQRIWWLEDDLDALRADLELQQEINRTVAAFALALEREEEKDPADWWKQ